MSDVKISALPAVTSVATTDVIPVVTGGVTSKIGSANFVNSGLSGGTANGVLYLNGSKAATSGSALTFDGTYLGLGGDPVTGVKLNVVQSASGYGLRVISASGASPYVAAVSGDGYRAGFNTGSAAGPFDFKAFDSQPMTWTLGASEQMRLTSTGLGIGTSSPSFSLDVGGQNGTNIALRSTGTASARFRAYVNGSESGVIGFLNNGGQFFEVAGSEQMRLSSDGTFRVKGAGTAGSTDAVQFSGSAPASSMSLDSYGNLHVPGGGGVSTNEAFGLGALRINTTGSSNTASGAYALYSNTTGSKNAASGYAALHLNKEGSYNTASGYSALYYNTTGSGNVMLGGANSAGAYAPVFDPTTEDNRVCISSTSVTNAYIQVAWTVVSDLRDKLLLGDVPHGLDFVTKLKPIKYQFKESRDSDIGHGPIKYGFGAQDVLALEGDNAVIVDTEVEDKLKITDSHLVPVLVKAIQEQQAIIESLTARITTLEGK